jgi:hypothetical protein
MAEVDDTLLARLRELSDKDEIRDIVYRRAKATDRRDLEQALSCYPPDGTEDHEGFDGPVSEYLATVSPVFLGNSPVEVGLHLIGNVEIELDGDSATVESVFLATVSADDHGLRREFLNTGRYLDDFVRRDGKWLIKHRRCAYEWSNAMEPTERWWDRTIPAPAG